VLFYYTLFSENVNSYLANFYLYFFRGKKLKIFVDFIIML